jgi:hypothetical protein
MVTYLGCPLPWSLIPRSMTHRPLLFRVQQQRHNEPTIKTVRAPRPTTRISYNDKEANHFLADVVWPKAIAGALKGEDAGIEDRYSAFMNVFFEADDELATFPLSGDLPSQRASGHDPSHPQERIDSIKKEVTSLIADLRRAKADTSPDPSGERAAIVAEIELDLHAAKAQLVRMENAFKFLSRKIFYEDTKAIIKTVSKLRTSNPYAMYRLLEDLLPKESDAFSNVIEYPDLATMHEHYRRQFEGDNKPVPAMSGNFWNGFISQAADASSGNVMLMEITADEIACPFNKSVAGSSPDADGQAWIVYCAKWKMKAPSTTTLATR